MRFKRRESWARLPLIGNTGGHTPTGLLRTLWAAAASSRFVRRPRDRGHGEPERDHDRPGALHPTRLIDRLERKKPLPVLVTTQVTPANADLQRNRPTVTEEP
jgi:hypothetical protein